MSICYAKLLVEVSRSAASKEKAKLNFFLCNYNLRQKPIISYAQQRNV